MKLSRASAIAVFAVTLMAETEKDEPRQGRDLAEELGVPADSLLKVMQQPVSYTHLTLPTIYSV